ncbi:deoxyribose-phosphate aldolase [Mariniflexile ostreae]|uniref:Deoxyribose-phosphate aldolase n=1 Tax=Mariniflexile ostreae TaxID=1520892 RepID=A0ABV5FAU4_9FLAO
MNIAHYIDFTLLKPSLTEREIIEFCKTAKTSMFNAVCINSAFVPLVKQLLEGSTTKTCCTIGFPLGTTATASKVYEAIQAVKDGADEIEMVINLGFLKSQNHVSVLKDIVDVKLAIANTPLKVIIEISELNKNEVIKACEICMDAQVDYIKTSSGFSKSGATFTDVKIIKKTVRDMIKICASGGIDDYDTALKYIDAGADRISTSTTIENIDKSRQIRNTKIYTKYIETLQNTKTTEKV